MNSEIFKFTDQRQQKIYEDLLLLGPGPAEFYKDAIKLIYKSSQIESTTNVVAHLLREIESALRDVLRPLCSESRVEEREKEQIKEYHRSQIEMILDNLRIPKEDSSAKAWLSIPGRLHRYAHRNALDAPRRLDAEFIDWFVELEGMLSLILNKLRERFNAVFERIDRLCERYHPTISDVRELKERIPNNQITLFYFFQKCSDEWLLLLEKEGFFSSPPNSEFNQESKVVRFTPWAQSYYLTRIALLQLKAVMETILRIPDTDNIRIQEDFVDAVLNMPPGISIKLLEKAKGWVKNQIPSLLLPIKLGDLVVYYAKGNQVDAAFELAKALFEILPDPDWQKATKEDTKSLSPEPRIKYNFWDYTENLKKCLQPLLELDGEKSLGFFCEILSKAIVFSLKKDQVSSSYDMSALWRPAIENHGQNDPHELKSLLTEKVRDAAVWLVEKGNMAVQDVLRSLEVHYWKVFRRIQLHLLMEFAGKASDSVEKWLSDQEIFKDSAVYHEYTLLLQKCFNHLPSETQQMILGWIDKGPDIEKYKKGVKERTGKPSTVEEISKYQRFWQRDWLFFLKDHLDSKHKRQYKNLEEELGSPKHPGLLSYISSWTGPTSPKSAQELQEMPIADLVQYLKEWMPSEDHFAPSPEGLGRTLSSIVPESPQKYAEVALDFKDLDPTYLRSLLKGLCDALNRKSSFGWGPVFDLCEWVVEQPVEIPGRRSRPGIDLDSDWSETRKTIADLLSKGFEDQAGSISSEYKQKVWSILKPLTEDSDPTPEYEEKFGGSNFDPLTISINTTRGEAMHALIRYALWIRRDQEGNHDEGRINLGFEAMPGVREVLERHLDISVEPSLAIRSVYGQWLPWLILLDKRWAKEKLSVIFPQIESQAKFFIASWDAYILFNRAYDDVFDVFQEKYELAIEYIGAVRDRNRAMGPDEKLAHHLMSLYWRGKIALDEPQGLLHKFWEKASAELRAAAIGFVGNALKNTEGDVPSEYLQRMKILWENRLAKAQQSSNRENYKSEIMAFSWWFISEKLDDEWAVKQLLEALKVANGVEMERLVMEKLVKLVEKMPIEVIDCVEYIVNGAGEGWTIHGISDYLKVILSKALETGSAEKAVNIINRLLSLGHFGFRDLLERG